MAALTVQKVAFYHVSMESYETLTQFVLTQELCRGNSILCHDTTLCQDELCQSPITFYVDMIERSFLHHYNHYIVSHMMVSLVHKFRKIDFTDVYLPMHHVS